MMITLRNDTQPPHCLSHLDIIEKNTCKYAKCDHKIYERNFRYEENI